MNSEKWHIVEREITFITTFLANEGSTLCFFFLRGLKLLSIQFQQNWHFTEEDEYVKEHSLVRFRNIIETRSKWKCSIVDLI